MTDEQRVLEFCRVNKINADAKDYDGLVLVIMTVAQWNLLNRSLNKSESLTN